LRCRWTLMQGPNLARYHRIHRMRSTESSLSQPKRLHVDNFQTSKHQSVTEQTRTIDERLGIGASPDGDVTGWRQVRTVVTDSPQGNEKARDAKGCGRLAALRGQPHC
jgi:hypothetical protein